MEDLDEAAIPGLCMHGPGHPDRLVGGFERGIAANLGRDHLARSADPGDVLAFRRLAQAPVEVALARAVRRHAARRDLERRVSEVPDQMVPLGRDVAVIEIDEHDLGLDDVLGARITRRKDRARHDEERHAGICGPVRLLVQPCCKLCIRLEKRRMRRRIHRALLGESPDWHPVLAIAEDDLRVDRDHGAIR